MILDQIKQIQWRHPQTEPIISFKDLKHIEAGFTGRSTFKQPYEDLNQVHGNRIIRAGSKQEHADGIYTEEENLLLAIKTADCLPILFAHKNKRFVMGLHVGWRGLCDRIILSGAQLLKKMNYPLEEFCVALGPCISLKNFEVGLEVFEKFENNFMDFNTSQKNLCWQKGKQDKWHLDLSMAAAIELLVLGFQPELIEACKNCTYDEHQNWYSYRRSEKLSATKNRNYAWIKIK